MQSGICPPNANQPSGKPSGGHHTPMGESEPSTLSSALTDGARVTGSALVDESHVHKPDLPWLSVVLTCRVTGMRLAAAVYK